MSVQSVNDDNAMASGISALQTHWRSFLIQGVLLIMLGILAIALPVITTFAIETLIGWLLLIGGIWRLVSLARSPHVPGFGWSIATTIVAIVVGAMFLTMPLSGMFTLTMLLISFFILEAIAKILLALDLRKHSHRWSWTLASGILNFFLAALIFLGWPSTAAWAIGLLFGVNMIFFGGSLVMISLAMHTART